MEVIKNSSIATNLCNTLSADKFTMELSELLDGKEGYAVYYKEGVIVYYDTLDELLNSKFKIDE